MDEQLRKLCYWLIEHGTVEAYAASNQDHQADELFHLIDEALDMLGDKADYEARQRTEPLL